MTSFGVKVIREFFAYTVSKRVNPLLFFVSKNFLKLVILAVLFWAVLFFLGQTLKPFFFIAIFLLLSSVSLIYNRWLKTSLGIEFVMLSTVMTARVYGPIPGAIVGFIGLTAAEIIGTGFNARTLISLGAIAIIGLITPFFSSLSILAAGMILTIIYDLMIIPFYQLAGSSPGRSALFVVTHIIWNLWVFAVMAPPLERLMML